MSMCRHLHRFLFILVTLYSLVNIGKQDAVFEFNRKKIGNILRDKKREGSPAIVAIFDKRH